MHRRSFIIGLIASLRAAECRADQWSLITEEEFEREKLAPQIAAAPATPTPGAPIIEVKQPDETQPIQTPVTIRILFHPQSGATIDLPSFKVTYGFLGLDITDRIKQHAGLSPTGLSADNAQLPSGHYRVTLQIADNLHRVASRTLDFTVV
jgi:hypothetical protein